MSFKIRFFRNIRFYRNIRFLQISASSGYPVFTTSAGKLPEPPPSGGRTFASATFPVLDLRPDPTRFPSPLFGFVRPTGVGFPTGVPPRPELPRQEDRVVNPVGRTFSDGCKSSVVPTVCPFNSSDSKIKKSDSTYDVVRFVNPDLT